MKIAPTDGRQVRFRALGTRFVVTAEQTGGTLAIVEHDLGPRSLGAPTHTHEREDEISHVISGRLGAQIGDEVVEAGPGDLVRKPRGVPHAFWNAGDEEARLLELISPAGFAQFFADASPILMADGPPDIPALAAVQARYGLTMDFSSIEPLVRGHGLVWG